MLIQAIKGTDCIIRLLQIVENRGAGDMSMKRSWKPPGLASNAN